MPRNQSLARGYRKRRVGTREVRQRFLIVCEGERTEPDYFEGFRTPRIVIRLRSGQTDPIQIVEEAERIWRGDREAFDQVWCVFDRDEIPAERFNRAIQMAEQRKIKVAYSNPSFELWLVLHFQECNGVLSREDFCRRLDGYLGHRYQKNDHQLFNTLAPNTQEAVNRAERLLAQYSGETPANSDPSTTVHTLVLELHKHSQPS